MHEKIEIIKKTKPIENEIFQLLMDDEALLKFIQGNILDQWALFSDESEYNLKYFNLRPTILYKLKSIDLDEMTFAEFFTLSTPTRRIAIAKYLATKKKESTNR